MEAENIFHIIRCKYNLNCPYVDIERPDSVPLPLIKKNHSIPPSEIDGQLMSADSGQHISCCKNTYIVGVVHIQ